MITELEHHIRERAHKIWEREGRPADRAEVHWSLARAEIAAEAPKPARPATAAPMKLRSKAAAAAAPKVEKAEKTPKPAPKAKAPKA